MKVLGAAVAAETGKKVAEAAYQETKKRATSKAGREAIKKGAKTAAPIVAAVARTAGAAGAILYAGGAALKANRAREAKKYADAQLAATEKRLGKQKLTPEQKATLRRQYEEHYKKRPVTNSTLGK